jgi:hypothetical protein
MMGVMKPSGSDGDLDGKTKSRMMLMAMTLMPRYPAFINGL